MKDGFIKVAAITPNVKVADVDYNCQEIVKRIQEAAEKDAKVMVFPELSITGYTCQDLFLQDCSVWVFRLALYCPLWYMYLLPYRLHR